MGASAEESIAMRRCRIRVLAIACGLLFSACDRADPVGVRADGVAECGPASTLSHSTSMIGDLAHPTLEVACLDSDGRPYGPRMVVRNDRPVVLQTHRDGRRLDTSILFYESGRPMDLSVLGERGAHTYRFALDGSLSARTSHDATTGRDRHWRFYPSGARRSLITTVLDVDAHADLFDGPVQIWAEDGALLAEGQHARDTPVGRWRCRDHAGAVFSSANLAAEPRTAEQTLPPVIQCYRALLDQRAAELSD